VKSVSTLWALAPREVAAHRVTLRVGCHHAQQQVAQRWTLVRWYPLVDRFGGPRDCPAYAARDLVGGNSERVALAAPPGRTQRVRQQRERAGFALHLADEEIDYLGLQPQACSTSRSLDRLHYVVRGQGLSK
jgi:hypothetical protein